MKLTPAQEQFKADYIRDRGYWVPFNDGLLAHAPDFLTAYFDYAGYPARTGPLAARTRELIYVAIDSSTTHMFVQGLEIHVKAAYAAGCSTADLMGVMQLATAQGLDSLGSGLSIVVEELAAAGGDSAIDERPLDLREQAIRDRFVERFGDWPRWCDLLVRRAPDYAERMVTMLTAPCGATQLDPKTRSLVQLALAAAPTHLDLRAVREHTRSAIRSGATGEELVEVLQLCAHLGVHACVIGVPFIAEHAPAGEPAAE
jgi:alkylhydroperoxidase/carboxymuconolactone decarboxylase family protein YurZ